MPWPPPSLQQHCEPARRGVGLSTKRMHIEGSGACAHHIGEVLGGQQRVARHFDRVCGVACTRTRHATRHITNGCSSTAHLI